MKKEAKRVKLTEGLIRNCTYEGEGGEKNRKVILWDTELNGLGLRLYPSGRKSFILRYPKPGKATQSSLMTLGEWTQGHKSLSLYQAREIAGRIRTQVFAGEDPKKKVEQGKPFKELSAKFIEDYAKERKRSWKDDQYRLDKYILPALGEKPIAEITDDDVDKLITDVGKQHKTVANRILALLSVMFNKARLWKMVDSTHRNPCEFIEPFTEKVRERVLTEDELLRLFEAADKHFDPYIGPFLRLVFLTGARKNEILRMKWEQVDFKANRIRFVNTKNNRDHVMRPAPLAMAILERLATFRTSDHPYIFPGKLPNKPRTSIQKAWRTILKDAKLVDVRTHDLRRTMATWLSEHGATPFDIQAVLNQKDPSVMRHYVHLSGNSTAAPLSKIAERLMQIEGNDENGENGNGS